MVRTLIIVPAHNEELSILKVVSEIKKKYPQFDVCVINDESSDQTKSILEKNDILHLNAPINLGIGGAVQLGYQYAEKNDYAIAVQCDGDGQHDASYIENIINPILEKKADICIGSRYILKEGFQSTFMRRIGKSFLCKLIYICCGYKSSDPTSGFRAVNKEWICKYAKDYPQDYPEPEALIQAVMHGARIQEVPVRMKRREYGESSISMVKSVYYMVKVSMAIMFCRWRKG